MNADFLQQAQNHADGMIPYQHASLQALRELGPDVQAALSLKSLFVVQHCLQNLDVDFFLDEVEGFGDLMTGYFDYPLVMECILSSTTEGPGQNDIQITMDARFDAVVISKKQMVGLCRQFRHVVEQLDNIDQLDTLDDIRLASRDDVDQVISWNASQPWECVEKTVHDIISDQVRLNPNAVAITGWDGQMSYLELDEHSTRVAKILVPKSIGPETIVPLCFEKSKWAVVAALAVLKAGGVVTQLGVSHPLSRKKKILEDTKARLVLVPSTNIGDQFTGIVPRMVIDEQSTAQLLEFNTPLPEIKPNAAYILFTSGSTGGGQRAFSFSHGGQFKINQSTRVLQFAAYTFDISCADIFITLKRGTTICIPSEYECINDLTSAVTKYRADWMFVTPTVAQLIDPESVPSLRTLVLGGEAPTAENVTTWANRLDLIFIWGPAETTIYTSAYRRPGPPLRGKDKQAASDQIATIRQLLEEHLPGYMIPTVWICAETMTLTGHGKMDGTAVAKWAENFDHEAYQDLLLDSSEYDTKVESAVAASGQATVIRTLASQARAAGIDLSVRDILKAKPPFGMAEAATPIKSDSPFPITEIDAPRAEVLDTPFRLSPIQNLFFDTAGPPPGSSTSHFTQTILHNAERIEDRNNLYKILAERNSAFDISQGPIFAAHLFNINNGSQEQLLLLSAHHLVIDVVSWLVILGDMEEFLISSKPGILSLEKPLPFHTWLHSQQEQPEENLMQANGLNSSLNGMQALDLTYWGMTDQANKYGSEGELSFSLDEEETARLLRGYGNRSTPAAAESVDIMVATLLQAFSAVFPDHAILPTVFSEGHGRESADKDVDPSGTVGWFTTLTPLHVVLVDNNVVNTIREIEILFNFLGSFQQLESKEGLFSDAPLLDNEIIIDNGPELNRLALFDVSAIVTGGRLKMTFKYNRRMQHQNRIYEWVTTMHSLLKVADESLSSLNTSELESIFAKSMKKETKEQMLDNLGVDMANVQEIVLCALLQQHMVLLMAQQSGLGIYEVELVFHITGDNINTAKLESAWQQVIDRHSILRTIF
ncbi:peptide synthetase [Metarhizium robertsii ARSEF 23]|uniref:Peptide synthetase n=1 Tax=Metarhizium robertsii (strain ARSEF 23 / ATCC MYA-3075) TaxID=655844 RepID=E9F2T5_METRA|nr:peptide synthetase [Metarhizium robertsii ARSEF 23]EFY97801.2 peptide synthetase [Metarhizium robertsii ARSEF 23]